MLDLKQGTRVEFNIDYSGVTNSTNNCGIKGTGKVVGIATSGAPVIGRSVIIEPDVLISSETYPFTHFVAFEGIHLKIIEQS